ncbi:MAG: tRNA (adenosine(37)-N6)-threonylcarbamoyltransferase complex ATPase subunit type 1 TsaE [Acidimicrobiales bacterium]
MRVIATYKAKSAGATRAVAKRLATTLVPGDIILLVGDLGAGKTTFVQGLAEGLGVTDPVTSPTFMLMRVLECGTDDDTQGGPVRRLLHADLYRLDQMSEVVDLGLIELVEDGAVAAVEWGDAGAPAFGTEVLQVDIARSDVATDAADDMDHKDDTDDTDDDERTVTVSGSESWEPRAVKIAAAFAST